MVVLDAADTFVGKFRRDTKAGVFDEEALHLIKCPRMFQSRHAGHAG